MGVMTVVTQLGVYGGLSLAANRGRTLLTANRALTVAIGRSTGAIFVAVAVLTAWHGWALA